MQETFQWPTGFSKLGLPQLTATEKAEISGVPCMVSQSGTLVHPAECGKIVLTFSKDLLVGTGHRKSEKKFKS